MMLIKKWKQLDWAIVIILALFMIVSFVVIRSAVYSDPDFAGAHVRQLFYYLLGFAVLFGASAFHYRLLLKLAPYLYVAGLGGLAAVYFFGAVINSSRGWFVVPGLGINVQPAEIMKLLLILMVAYWLARKEQEPLEFGRDLVPTGLIVLAPFALVVIQPDLGNAIIYLVIMIGMLWIANIKYAHVLIGLAAAAAAIAGTLYLIDTFHDPIERFLSEHGSGHWMDRIDAFLYPEQASSDQRYQLVNSLLAIGSGSLFGEGYLQGSSVHNNRIPYTYSDSIFVVIGEEFGFMGASVLLLLYFLLIYRLILISIQSNEPGGSYVIIGIVSMFVFQIFQNIGMFLDILPLTGITLPFISYGGSSLLINMLSIGIALSIKVHAKEPLDEMS